LDILLRFTLKSLHIELFVVQVEASSILYLIVSNPEWLAIISIIVSGVANPKSD